MVKNSYEGVLEGWKVELIRQRALRSGFRSQDLDDVVQQSVLVVMGFRFDEARSNGAAEATVLTAIVDRQLRMIRRCAMRERRRIERTANSVHTTYELAFHQEVVSAVRCALAGASPLDRRVCSLLADGHSTNDIAERFGMSWHTIDAAVRRIRRRFERCGLKKFLASDAGDVQ